MDMKRIRRTQHSPTITPDLENDGGSYRSAAEKKPRGQMLRFAMMLIGFLVLLFLTAAISGFHPNLSFNQLRQFTERGHFELSAINPEQSQQQLDIKNTFINGNLEEEVYIDAPPEFSEKFVTKVLPSLASTRAYFDFFSERADRESQELEEAEIEIDLLQKDKAMQEVLGNFKEDYITYDKDDNRLQQIKDNIQSLERSKLKEEVAARLQKKLVMRHARQKFLEEVALKEMKLLEELDRERKQELEQEIERQRQLEHERARTRELQFELDMERERQSQRELQRELELVESGVRSSWRDFSSNSSSRPREKFRERDNVRSGLEGLRPASRGHETVGSVQTAGSSFNASSTPSMVLSSSRSFSNQPPTILQPRDRPVERSNATFEDNLEGSRDSGDANSIGDPELSLAIDGLAGGFSSTSRRGSKSRQIMERREREGRREGKWERKHG